MKRVKHHVRDGKFGRPRFGDVQRVDRIGPFGLKDIKKVEIAYRPFRITQRRWTWLGPRRFRHEGNVFDLYVHMKYDKIYFIRRWVFEPDPDVAINEALESAQMTVRVKLLRQFDNILTTKKSS